MNVDDLIAAFSAVMEGKQPLLTQPQVNEEIQKLQARMRQKQQEAAAKEAAKNEAIGKEFLDKNRTAEGVQVTESGLAVQDSAAGQGRRCEAPDGH